MINASASVAFWYLLHGKRTIFLFLAGTMSKVNKVTVIKDTQSGCKRKGNDSPDISRSGSTPVISLTSGDDEPAVRNKMAEVISQGMPKFAISSAARSSSEGPYVGEKGWHQIQTVNGNSRIRPNNGKCQPCSENHEDD